MAKSRDAFRTISEVSTALDTPTHVLRFWESKFTQIKPLKRAGGRRYYRPDDIDLLSGIKTLLHDQGMTIKGAQKLLREAGVKHVVSLGRAAAHAPTADATIDKPLTPPAAENIPQTPPTQDKTAAKDVVAPIPAPLADPIPVPAPRADRLVALAMITSVNHDHIRINAAQISPLLARLSKLRDRLRAA